MNPAKIAARHAVTHTSASHAQTRLSSTEISLWTLLSNADAGPGTMMMEQAKLASSAITPAKHAVDQKRPTASSAQIVPPASDIRTPQLMSAYAKPATMTMALAKIARNATIRATRARIQLLALIAQQIQNSRGQPFPTTACAMLGTMTPAHPTNSARPALIPARLV